MSNEASGQAAIRQEPTTIWNIAFITLFIANLTFNMGQSMSNSLLPVYANHLGVEAAAIGMLMSTFALSAMLFRFISAPIMDTYNRKYLVVFAALMLSTTFAGFGISHSLPMLIGFRLLQGCGMAFGNACCIAMVSEVIPRDKYGSGIGYFSMAQVIATALGPSFGLALAGRFGYSTTFTVNAGVMLLTAVLASQIRISFVRTKKLVLSIRNVIAKEAMLPTLVLLLLIAGNAAVGSFLIIFAADRGVTAHIGLYFTVSAIATLITRPTLGRLTDRFGVAKVTMPALFLNIVALFIISFSHSLAGFLLAAVAASFGVGACMPGMQALSMKTVPNERRGSASSTNYIGMDIGVLIGPTLGGAIAQSMGYTMMWRITGFPLIIAILIIFFTRDKIEKIEKDFESQSAE